MMNFLKLSVQCKNIIDSKTFKTYLNLVSLESVFYTQVSNDSHRTISEFEFKFITFHVFFKKHKAKKHGT